MFRHRHMILASWRYLAILGLTGVAAFHIFVYKALEHSPAANAVLVLSTAPAVIVLISRFTVGERISARQWLGIAVSFAGAVVLIARGNLATLAGFELSPGDLWMLAAVPTWAGYSVLLRRRPRGMPERTLLTTSTVFGLLWMMPLIVASPRTMIGVEWTIPVIAGVAYVGLGASVVAYLCWNRGVALVGPSRAGSYLHLMPVFAPVLAFLLLGEALHGYHAIGAVLVFSGIALTQGTTIPLPGGRFSRARRS
jgi:drug/metabolite transporter (DMT)-like permease